jgi:hypothetical protein
MITVINSKGVCLKFLDAMNFVSVQTVESFVKSFMIKKIMNRRVFLHMKHLTQLTCMRFFKSEPFEKKDFFSYLKNSDISDNNYDNYVIDYKEKGFKNRLDQLEYYNNYHDKTSYKSYSIFLDRYG